MFYYVYVGNVVVRSIDSDAVFDEKSERTTKHWRKRPSMYQATDSTDSMSEPEEVSCVLQIVFHVMKPVYSITVVIWNPNANLVVSVLFCRILSPDKTEWQLISAALCG